MDKRKEVHTSDPLELKLANALTMLGIDFIHESQDKLKTNGLDFYLPDENIFIEIKQYYSERSGEQLKRQDEIILIQGKKSLDFFIDKLKK